MTRITPEVGLRIRVQRDPHRDPLGSGLFLFITRRDHPAGEGGARTAICTDIVMRKLDEREAGGPPEDYLTPHLTAEAAQDLMESLWDAGIRPRQAAGSIGQLAATEHHLADMRAIALHGLGIKKEGT